MTQAVIYEQTGGPEVLRAAELEMPTPDAGQVVVRVQAAGINPFDAKVFGGIIPSDAPFPRRIGSDLAGTVVAVGEGAEYWNGTPVAVGDEVLGSAAGAVAEHTVTPGTQLMLRPAQLSVEVAGSLHVPGLTAVSVLATVPVDANDTVLIGGASGAVGFVATQLAIAAGAKVIATAHPRNHDMLSAVGAVPVTYGEGLADRVRELGDVTAVFDCHGRDALDAGIALGVPVDRMVAIAAYAALAELGVNNVEFAARTPENLAALAEQVADGRVKYPIAATYSLDQVAEAYQAMQTQHAPGKIVITP